jgi:hypothetical protein
LKSVSRKRSDVGRVFNDGGLFNRRPRYLPPMIRMGLVLSNAASPPDVR